MTDQFNRNDLTELNARLSLIESMISEGRQKTESYGWTFVLWGIAYYVAIAWATLGHSNLAWPVTMVAAGILTGVIITRRAARNPETTTGRSIGAIWMGLGLALFVLCTSLAASGHAEQHVFVAVIMAMLGAANATSSIILKWKAQFACALAWLAGSAVSCFGTITQSSYAFLAAIFLCQIVFGIWLMISDARERKTRARTGAVHA